MFGGSTSKPFLRTALVTKVLLTAAALAAGGVAAAQEIVGVWRGAMAAPWGQLIDTEVIFFPNGTYASAGRAGTLMARHWGTYRFGGNWIHFDLQGWQPKQYCAHRGCVTLHWPTSETWKVTYFDGRLLRTSNGALRRFR